MNTVKGISSNERVRAQTKLWKGDNGVNDQEVGEIMRALELKDDFSNQLAKARCKKTPIDIEITIEGRKFKNAQILSPLLVQALRMPKIVVRKGIRHANFTTALPALISVLNLVQTKNYTDINRYNKEKVTTGSGKETTTESSEPEMTSSMDTSEKVSSSTDSRTDSRTDSSEQEASSGKETESSESEHEQKDSSTNDDDEEEEDDGEKTEDQDQDQGLEMEQVQDQEEELPMEKINKNESVGDYIDLMEEVDPDVPLKPLTVVDGLIVQGPMDPFQALVEHRKNMPKVSKRLLALLD